MSSLSLRLAEILFRLNGELVVFCFKDPPTFPLCHAIELRQHVMREVITPRRVTDMLLDHHPIPFAPGYRVVVSRTEQRVAPEVGAAPLCPLVGLRIMLLIKRMVHSLGVIHVVEIRHCLDGEQNELLVSIPVCLRERRVLSEGIALQVSIKTVHALPFSILEVERVSIEHLRRASSRIFALEVENPRSLRSLRLSKLCGTERTRMVEEIGSRESRWVPRHVDEELDRILHRLEVTDIEDPQTVDTILRSQRELFPHVLYRRHVKPLRIAGRTYIVDMVIESPSSLAVTLLRCGHPPHVAPVVIAEQQRHVVGYFHARIVIVHHLFV